MSDPHRALIYKTEERFAAEVSASDLSIKECQKFANSVMSFSTWLWLSSSQAPVVVTEGVKTQTNPNSTMISLALGHRNHQSILHEMAHVLLIRSKLRYDRPHGPLFTSVLVQLWNDHDFELAVRWKMISLEEGVRCVPIAQLPHQRI